MTPQITPILDQLYWKRNGDNYELVRQTQAAETVFFIASEAEFRAITQADKVEKLEGLVESLDALIEEEMGDFYAVAYAYLPIAFSNLGHMRDAIDTLKK
jgi:hypothetical protein